MHGFRRSERRRRSRPGSGRRRLRRRTPLVVARTPGLSEAQGLVPIRRHEKDSCGVGFVADMKEPPTHAIVQMGLDILRNLDHRGAVANRSEAWR